MTRQMLMMSLGMNGFLAWVYYQRCRRYDLLVEQQVNLGYRVNYLLIGNGIEPDRVVLDILQDLGIR